MQLKELAATRCLWIAEAGPLFISLWMPGVRSEDYDLAERLQAQHVARVGRSMSLTVLTQVDNAPGAADMARKRGQAMIAKVAGATDASAVVVTAPGLTGSVARSFITTFNMFSRYPYPRKTFSSVENAIAWCGLLKPNQGFDALLAHAINTQYKAFEHKSAQPARQHA